MKFPILSKAGALAAVILGLLWALWTVQSVVQERQLRQSQAEHNVANSLAGSQTLLGPVLLRQCTESWVSSRSAGPDSQATVDSKSHTLRLPASQLKLNARVVMTPRYRGMFKVNGYAMGSLVTAQWPDAAALTMAPEHEGGQVVCGEPTLSVAMSDARGIRVAELVVNGRGVAVQPGSGMQTYTRGFQASLGAGVWPGKGPLSVNLNLELVGTRALSVAPVASTTLVTVNANWPHPSFGGRFLPTERDVRTHGFTADWKVTSLASTAQQEWLNGSPLCAPMAQSDPGMYGGRGSNGSGEAPSTGCIESFGIEFMDPVNSYVLSDRASKYGLLFIVLTFVGVGLVEVLRRLRVHPIQYLLVGAALALFFLLLVSLSEHMAFAWAYAMASLACTVLLGFYGSFVLQGWRAGLAFGAGIAGLFGTLYALLQMEQTALVLGSVLLFVVLAVVMISTRKLDWYALMAQMRGEAAAATP